MVYIKNEWKDNIVQYPNRFDIKTNNDGTSIIKPNSGEIIQVGTPITSENLNHMEQGIEDAHNSIKKIENKQEVIESQMADYTKVIPYAIATGVANTYTITLSPAPTSYVDGMAVSVRININSTGASTINVNGLGAKAIKKENGLDVTNLKVNGVYTLRYNASIGNFILQGEGGEYGDAVASDVLAGKKIGTETGIVTGTMPKKTGITYTPTTSDQTIIAGFEDGTCKVKGDENLVPSNILSGKSIFGVWGNVNPNKNLQFLNVNNIFKFRQNPIIFNNCLCFHDIGTYRDTPYLSYKVYDTQGTTLFNKKIADLPTMNDLKESTFDGYFTCTTLETYSKKSRGDYKVYIHDINGSLVYSKDLEDCMGNCIELIAYSKKHQVLFIRDEYTWEQIHMCDLNLNRIASFTLPTLKDALYIEYYIGLTFTWIDDDNISFSYQVKKGEEVILFNINYCIPTKIITTLSQIQTNSLATSLLGLIQYSLDIKNGRLVL